jgi:hypothetical protein
MLSRLCAPVLCGKPHSFATGNAVYSAKKWMFYNVQLSLYMLSQIKSWRGYLKD